MATEIDSVCIDWNNDGDFTDPGEDISTDVQEFRWQRGKDSQFGNAVGASFEITKLLNSAGTYLP